MPRVAGTGAGSGRSFPWCVFVLALVLAGGACSAGHDGRASYIDDFVSRSPVAGCDRLPALTAQGFNVVDLVAAGDTGILMLTGLSRRLVSFDRSLQVRWEVDLEERGPNGIGSPESVAMVDDSMFYVVDGGQHLVKLLDRAGRERNTVLADFPLALARTWGGSTYVMPTVLGGMPDHLLYRIDGRKLDPEPLSPQSAAGVTQNAFVNMVVATPRGDGGLVIMHGFYLPRAYVWDGKSVHRFTMPVPDGVRGLFEHPRPVRREEDLPYLPVVALSPYVDRPSRDIVYLTRSGRSRGDHSEKALVRVDSTFHYVNSRLLPVDALFIAPLSHDSVVVVSNEGEWNRCEAP
ncbi:MAG: hypothetical protein P8Z36_01715 [Gemmatimonadota bacterium]|jgi:hypothetical protein